MNNGLNRNLGADAKRRLMKALCFFNIKPSSVEIMRRYGQFTMLMMKTQNKFVGDSDLAQNRSLLTGASLAQYRSIKVGIILPVMRPGGFNR